jgi:3-methyladenine DNA glycosylase Tag
MRHVHLILQSKSTALKGARLFLDLEKTLGRFELLAWTFLKKQGLKNWIQHVIRT